MRLAETIRRDRRYVSIEIPIERVQWIGPGPRYITQFAPGIHTEFDRIILNRHILRENDPMVRCNGTMGELGRFEHLHIDKQANVRNVEAADTVVYLAATF